VAAEVIDDPNSVVESPGRALATTYFTSAVSRPSPTCHSLSRCLPRSIIVRKDHHRNGTGLPTSSFTVIAAPTSAVAQYLGKSRVRADANRTRNRRGLVRGQGQHNPPDCGRHAGSISCPRAGRSDPPPPPEPTPEELEAARAAKEEARREQARIDRQQQLDAEEFERAVEELARKSQSPNGQDAA
jgi:hypothetical protein